MGQSSSRRAALQPVTAVKGCTGTIRPVPSRRFQGLVIAPASGGGRFLRHYGNVIDPARDMGADNTGRRTRQPFFRQQSTCIRPDVWVGEDAGSEGKLGLGVGLLGAFKVTAPLSSTAQLICTV